MPDFKVESFGTVSLVTPLNAAAYQWTNENVELDPWQWLGGSFAVDRRCVQPLVEGMEGDGLAVDR